MIKKSILSALILSSLVTLSSLADAATDKAALLDKIRKQSSNYSEFKELLNSPEQSLRFSAFDAMVNSGDATLREMAIDEALAYPDATLQAVAFREVIMSFDTITFDISAPENADEQTKKEVSAMGGTDQYRLEKKNIKTGTIGKCRYKCKGQVSGLTLTLATDSSSNECQLNASLEDGTSLIGELRCPDMMPMKASTRLR